MGSDVEGVHVTLAILQDILNRCDDLGEKIEVLAEKIDEIPVATREEGSNGLWLPLVIIAVAVSVYGCEKADEVKAHREAFKSCVAAKDLTPACQFILQGRMQ